MKSLVFKFLALMLVVFAASCGGEKAEPTAAGSAGSKPKSMIADEPSPMENKGIGPITTVDLGASVDAALAEQGKGIYDKMCTACHKPTEKFIGPAPVGILDRRSPEWVMNMILNPVEMTQKDPIAKKLLMEFNGSPMADQNLTEEEARAVLEYFRTL